MFENLFQTKKLDFRISDETGTITLTQALAGEAGTVCLGENGVHLWSLIDKQVPKDKEMVFDFRNHPLTPTTKDVFRKAVAGHYMTAHVCLVTTINPERIADILEVFDYVLVPNQKINNTYKDLRSRVLSYTID